MLMNALRRNIGVFVALIGFALLCILTFGDIAEIATEQYWQNVLNNITSIGFTSVCLTAIQTTIKQGLCEQALQRGLNSEKAAEAYKEHRELIKKNTERMPYMPYFLQDYNHRHTLQRRREFLLSNNYSNEDSLLLSKRKKLIRRYRKICTRVTVDRIKWSTSDIKYDKYNCIETLAEHRAKRVGSAIISSAVFMFGVTFVTRGLFMSTVEEPLYQKCIKLATYILAIFFGSLLGIVKEYEKGAFGIPAELDDINEIWIEFSNWKIPDSVYNEVNNVKEVHEDEREETADSGRTLQEESKEEQVAA